MLVRICSQALQWLRGPSCDIKQELKDLFASAERSEPTTTESESKICSTISAFSKPSAYKPFLILVMLFFLQQAT
jgi:hypothetical protein